MNVALCIVLTCLPVLITGCKRQHRLALPAEERSENKVALALGKSSENINAREQFLIPLDEEPAKDFGTDEKEKEKNNAEENKKENISKKERASEKKKVNPDPNQKINTSKESRKKTRETREDDAPVTLDFSVENNTGRTIFVTCFSYIKKRVLTRWRWDKSKIYQLEPGQTADIDVDYIPDPIDRKNVYAYLGVFHSYEEADEATYELTDERLLLDLDLLKNLYGKKVTVEIEKYGSRKELLEYDFVKKKREEKSNPRELDFLVENQTGKTVHVVGFIYEKKAKGSWFGAIDEKDDMSIWRYDKTPILTLKDKEAGYADVDSLFQGRDRLWARGFIAVFDESERELAERSTYELVESWRKLRLDRLEKLFDKKIVLCIEEYSTNADFIDYVIKEPQSALKKKERAHDT